MQNNKEQQAAEPTRGWEYAKAGDYHRNLDPNWEYTPTYHRKMKVVTDFLRKLPSGAAILDVGCGEGVVVEEMRAAGLNMCGVDLNYESPFVKLGSVLQLPYSDSSFDAVTLLDVFEHLTYDDQPKALQEIKRVLKPNGHFVASIPNLAHFNSRTTMLLKGWLDRTDIESYHVGERPIRENEALLKKAGFTIEHVVGITLTVPWVYRRLICRHAAKLRGLHDFFEPFARLAPGLAMINVFFCRSSKSEAA